MSLRFLLLALVGNRLHVPPVLAHIAPFVHGMFCENSTDVGVPFNPLTNLTKEDWWMHAYDGCDKQPPNDGIFLELPAGGVFSVQMAEHKGYTTLSDPPTALGNFGNGQDYDPKTFGNLPNGTCITSPNLHARNRQDAAGSAFAISYTSNMSLVTPENLAVFSVAPNTPFERMAKFAVPVGLPTCPLGGCICAWGWVPNGCGTLNMYMLPYRCKVTNGASTMSLAAPSPPKYCHNDPKKCIGGAKQMIFVYQQDGNNIEVPPNAIQQISPGYSLKNGFYPGAQNDIFVNSVSRPLPLVNGTVEPKKPSATPLVKGERYPQRPLRFARDLVIDPFPVTRNSPYSTSTDKKSSATTGAPISIAPSSFQEPGTPVYPVATPAPPMGKPDKLVVAHVIIGNTYPYTKEDWLRNIKLAWSKGIDAFALNYGTDPWQPSRIADAYDAAMDSGTGFKMFLSPDLTVVPCQSAEDGTHMKEFIQSLAAHNSQLIYQGRALLSSFAGEYCKFGTNDVNTGWANVVRDGTRPIAFVPAWFVDPLNSSFAKDPVLDGLFAWDSSWPKGPDSLSWDYDEQHSASQGLDRIYMAAVSPWFYTHYSSKNWFYGGDEWLYNTRWEALVAHRDRIDIVEIISWNDFGESHYVGPIEGAQPGSQAWVDGSNHTAWLDMGLPYVRAFKTGTWPALDRDALYLWSRPHPQDMDIPEDVLGKPLGWNWTSDYLWATVHAVAPASVELTSGNISSVFSVYPGITKLRMASQSGPIRGTLSRHHKRHIEMKPDSSQFTYNSSRLSGYNYNAFVIGGSASVA